MGCASGELFGVGIHHRFHIFPDGQAFGIQHIGKNGSAIITAFSSQRGAFIFIGCPDKTLC